MACFSQATLPYLSDILIYFINFYMTKSSCPIPSHYQLVYSQEQIDSRVQELAQTIGAWCKNILDSTQQPVLAVCIMRGGIFFYADLLRQIPCSVELAVCQASSYAKDQNAQSLHISQMVIDSLKPENRCILLVDDICDSGKTLKNLHNYCTESGALTVKTATIIHRLRPDSVFTPEYIGFSYSDKNWLVGYGMDDANQHSNIPGIYIIPNTSY